MINSTNNMDMNIEDFMHAKEHDTDVKISLFVVCPNNQKLKKLELLSLEGLTSEERKAKLASCPQQHLIAVIETSNKIFAHIHHQCSEQEVKELLSLNNKEVVVRSFTDEQLSDICQTFEATFQEQEKKNDKSEKSISTSTSSSITSHSSQNISTTNKLEKSSLVFNASPVKENLVGQKIREEDEREVEEDIAEFKEEKRNKARQHALDEEIENEILKAEINKQDIESKITKDSTMAERRDESAALADADKTDPNVGVY